MKKFAIVVILGLALAILVLYSKIVTQNDRVDDLQAANKKALDRISQMDEGLNSQNAQIQALSNAIENQKAQLILANKRIDEQQNTLLALKEDVAKGVEAALTKQVIDMAAEKALQNIGDNKVILKDPVLLSGISKTLATTYRQELRGQPGADADNAVVAKLLAADPDFLNRVSVTTLIQPNTPSP